MYIKLYFDSPKLTGSPLVAIARIPGRGQTEPPWDPGTIEFYPVDLDPYLTDPASKERWDRRIAELPAKLTKRLQSFTFVMNRRSLQPWSREAFENFAEFGIMSLFLRAELFEDDDSPWDPSTAIPLYPDRPGPF